MSAGKTQILDRRVYETGKAIFEQGDIGDAAYVVESGEVGIYRDIDGERVKVGTVKPGGLFGEMAVIDATQRMATAIAEAPTVLVRVPKSAFDQKLAAADPFIRGLIAVLITNIRLAHKRFAKRPRSVADHLRVLEACARDLRAAADATNGAGLAAALADLDSAIERVKTAAAGHGDRRHSVLSTEDIQGVSLRDILDKG